MSWIKQIKFNLLWPFYIYKIIQSLFLLTTAYWAVFFLNNGYSMAQISLLPTVMLFSIFLLELPTGLLADIKSRKVAVIIGIFVQAIAVSLIPFISGHFEILIILYILMGIGAAFISGAMDAWIVDFLHWHNKSQIIPNYYAASHALINIGFVVSSLLASLIIFLLKDMRYLWRIEGAMIFLAGIILLFFAREKTIFQQNKSSLRLFFYNVFRVFYKSPELMEASIIMLLLAVIFGMTTILWQPFLQTKGIPLSWFGMLFAFSGLLAIIYPAILPKIRHKIKNTQLLKLISLAQTIGFIILLFIPFIGIIALFLILQNLDSLKLPLFQPWFQEHAPSEIRGTISSIIAMIGALGEGIGYITAGQLTQRIGDNIWFIAAGLSTLIFLIFYFYSKRMLYKNKKII